MTDTMRALIKSAIGLLHDAGYDDFANQLTRELQEHDAAIDSAMAAEKEGK